MFESGDEYDKKQNKVPDASAVKRGNNYFVLHKGGRDGYKLHITDKYRLIAAELPNGNIVRFNGWKSHFDGSPHSVAKAAWEELTGGRYIGVSGRPIARLSVTKQPDHTSPHKFPRDTPRSGIISLQENKIVVRTEDSGVTDVFSGLDAVEIEYRGVEPPTPDQSQTSESYTGGQYTALPSVDSLSIPSSTADSYPELTQVLDQAVYDSHTRLSKYLREHSNDGALQQLAAELLSVLGYETSQDGESDSYYDFTAKKETRRIRVKVFVDETVDEVDLELCGAQIGDNELTRFFVIMVNADLTTRAQITGRHSDIRIIDSEELQQLVEGAVLRIGDTP